MLVVRKNRISGADIGQATLRCGAISGRTETPANGGSPAPVDRLIRRSAGAIPASAILDEVCRVSLGKLILVEGGPRLLGDFYAERLIDEQFLTLAPQIAGRDAGDQRLSLVMGKTFAPRDALWGTLIDVRRHVHTLNSIHTPR